FPSKLVAGGSWSPFGITFKNVTDKPLDEVYPVFFAVSEDSDLTTDDLQVEYKNPDSGVWERVEKWTDGEYFGYFSLRAKESATLEMRVRASATAPLGDGFSLVTGDYYNEDGSCGWNDGYWYDFTILKPGTDPGTVPPAKPGTGDGKDH